MILNKRLVILSLILGIISIILERNMLIKSGIVYVLLGIYISVILFLISGSNYISNNIKIYIGQNNSSPKFDIVEKNDVLSYIEKIDKSNKKCVYYAKSFLTPNNIISYMSRSHSNAYIKDAINYIIESSIDDGDISLFCGVISRNYNPSRDISDYLIYEMFLEKIILDLPNKSEASSQILFLYPYSAKGATTKRISNSKNLIIKAVSSRKMAEMIRNAKLPIKSNAIFLSLIVSGIYVIK